MFTQTHVLIGAALFAHPRKRAVAIAGLAGAVVPDCDVWAMFVIERLAGASSCEIFHYRYWQQPWTTVQMVFNAFPLYLALLAAGLGMWRMASGRGQQWGQLVAVFAASALVHLSVDFLLHHEDARAQWMPFSDWVFRSPVSYWDPNHFGHIFMPFEIVLGLSLAFVVGRRFHRRWVWLVLLLLTLGYGANLAAGQVSTEHHPRGPGSCEALEAEKAGL